MNKEVCNCKHSQSNAQNGFLWGVIVGGVIVFLLVTKKGRHILKAVSEEGFDKLHEYIDVNKLNSIKESFDEVDEDEFEGVEDAGKDDVSAKKRRFFKRKKS